MIRSPRQIALLGSTAACLLTAALVPTAAPAAQRAYKPAGVNGAVAVFHVPQARGARVVSAHLRRGPWQYTVKSRTLRTATKQGRMRVRVPRQLRRFSGRRMQKVRLVVDLRKPFSDPNAPTGDAPTASKPATRPSTTPGSPAARLAPGATPVIPPDTSGWRAPRSAPLTDDEAAARVVAASEIRPANTAANSCVPTDSELAAFNATRFSSGGNAGNLANDWMPTRPRVTGRFTGTTDEILQWAAHKWGIPVDVARAVADTESDWHQSKMGDRNSVSDPSVFPAQSRISGNDVYESLGIMQIKWRPETQHPGTEPLRWKCTAFNADYWAATVRFFYDGLASPWFGSSEGYGAGQAWESVGGWFNPTPWNNGDMHKYVGWVKDNLANRDWERAGF